MFSRTLILLLLALLEAARLLPAADFQDPRLIDSFAFGSCADQKKPQPFWPIIAAQQPQVFLFLGDNVYADAELAEEFQAAYSVLASIKEYKDFRSQIPILATWDDHDYGLNDSGREYPLKKKSQAIMLNFFQEPGGSPRRAREGVYGSWLYGPPGRQVEFILLDTRYFRSPLLPMTAEEKASRTGRWAPNDDPAATILGAAQWIWLERTLLESPAQLLVIGSSIQVLPLDHGWEKWGNFPLERERLLTLLRYKPAILLSGDRHLGEISRIDGGTSASPLYEVTASGLTNSYADGGAEPNRLRVSGDNVTEPNFGKVRIDWANEEQGVPIIMDLFLCTGAKARSATTTLRELNP